MRQGAASGASNPQFQKWPKGTKWAFFKTMPAGMMEGRTKGWVRVGSALWKQIQDHNAGTHLDGSGVGSGRGASRGRGNSVPNTQFHPSAKTTQQWSPGSPQGRKERDTSRVGVAGSDPRGGNGQTSGTGGNTPPKTPKTPKAPPKGPDPFSKFLGNPNTGKLQDPATADALAGLQYDAQIHDARTQLADQGAQGQQDLADISHWYTQIQDANNRAAVANQAQVAQSAGAQDNVTQSLMDAIGGSANSSAGAVAAQGAGQSAAMRQLGLLQQQYQSNLGTALDSQQAGQMSAQQALISQGAQQIHQTIQDLLGQRGQAVVQNGQTIDAFNNSVSGQNYQNRIAKLEAILAAHTTMGNQRLQGLQIQQAQQAQAGGGAGAFKPWMQQSPEERVATVKLLVAGGANGGLIDEASALSRATQMGYDAALVRPFLNTYYGVK